MSYYIEHNRAVAVTKDGYYILLLKGGDNNLISNYSGKPVLDWSFLGITKDEEAFKNYLFSLSKNFHSGGAQTPSGWAKDNGINDHYMLRIRDFKNAYRRYMRAFNKTIDIDFSIEDIPSMEEDALQILSNELVKKLKESGYNMLDQDGREITRIDPPTVLSSSMDEYLGFSKEVIEKDAKSKNYYLHKAIKKFVKEREDRYKDITQEAENTEKNVFSKNYTDLEQALNAKDYNFFTTLLKSVRYANPLSDSMSSLSYKTKYEMDKQLFEIFVFDKEFISNLMQYKGLPRNIEKLYRETPFRIDELLNDKEKFKQLKEAILSGYREDKEYERTLKKEAEKDIKLIEEGKVSKLIEERLNESFDYEEIMEKARSLKNSGYKIQDPQKTLEFVKEINRQFDYLQYRNVDKILDINELLKFKRQFALDPDYVRDKVVLNEETLVVLKYSFSMRNHPKKFSFIKKTFNKLANEMGDYLNNEVRYFMNTYTGEEIIKPLEEFKISMPIGSAIDKLFENAPKEIVQNEEKIMSILSEDNGSIEIPLDSFNAKFTARKEGENAYIAVENKDGGYPKNWQAQRYFESLAKSVREQKLSEIKRATQKQNNVRQKI